MTPIDGHTKIHRVNGSEVLSETLPFLFPIGIVKKSPRTQNKLNIKKVV